jgi:hypothetical protein
VSIGPGTIMVHRSGGVVVISRRKRDGSGWWNTDGSGFSDAAVRHEDWTPYTPAELVAALDARSRCSDSRPGQDVAS